MAAAIFAKSASGRALVDVTYTCVGLRAPAGNDASSCVVASADGESEGMKPDRP